MKERIDRLSPEEMGNSTQKPLLVTENRLKRMLFGRNYWYSLSRFTRIAVISFVILIIYSLYHYFNLFVTESFYVKLEAAQMEAEIQRKNELIPGLVKVVEDHMAFEGRVFIHATDVREALEPLRELSGDGRNKPLDKQSVAKFKSSISKFQAVAEKYPVLTSSEAYVKLMLELANTETRLARARINYNLVVTRYNTTLALLPACL